MHLTRRSIWIVLVVGIVVFTSTRSPAAEPTTADAPKGSAPSLEWLREAIIRRGVTGRLVRIEKLPEDATNPAAGAGRIVFWTKTKRITQTVVIAVVANDAYVRIQSCDLATVRKDHPRFADFMAYALDRNFAMSGVQFARDANDGEVVLRSDVPCANGVIEEDFVQVLEAVVRAADDESPRLWALVGRPGE